MEYTISPCRRFFTANMDNGNNTRMGMHVPIVLYRFLRQQGQHRQQGLHIWTSAPRRGKRNLAQGRMSVANDTLGSKGRAKQSGATPWVKCIRMVRALQGQEETSEMHFRMNHSNVPCCHFQGAGYVGFRYPGCRSLHSLCPGLGSFCPIRGVLGQMCCPCCRIIHSDGNVFGACPSFINVP